MASCVSLSKGKVLLSIRARPGAGRSAIRGIHDGAVKLDLSAAPEKGKANSEMIRFIAGALGVAKGNLTLRSGKTSRIKVLEISGLTKDDVVEKLDINLCT